MASVNNKNQVQLSPAYEDQQVVSPEQKPPDKVQVNQVASEAYGLNNLDLESLITGQEHSSGLNSLTAPN